MAHLIRAFLVAFLVAACSDSRNALVIGDQCTLASECSAPLVCAYGRCRRECETSRDCAAGLTCVRDNAGLGSCLLPAEANCERTSDCPSGLACRDRRCQAACAESRDCPAGQLCRADANGLSACVEPERTSCLHNTDCPLPFVCGAGQQCELECALPESVIDGGIVLPAVPPGVDEELYWQTAADRDCPPERFCVLPDPRTCDVLANSDRAVLDRCALLGRARTTLTGAPELSSILHRCYPRVRVVDGGVEP